MFLAGIRAYHRREEAQILRARSSFAWARDLVSTVVVLQPCRRREQGSSGPSPLGPKRRVFRPGVDSACLQKPALSGVDGCRNRPLLVSRHEFKAEPASRATNTSPRREPGDSSPNFTAKPASAGKRARLHQGMNSFMPKLHTKDSPGFQPLHTNAKNKNQRCTRPVNLHPPKRRAIKTEARPNSLRQILSRIRRSIA